MCLCWESLLPRGTDLHHDCLHFECLHFYVEILSPVKHLLLQVGLAVCVDSSRPSYVINIILCVHYSLEAWHTQYINICMISRLLSTHCVQFSSVKIFLRCLLLTVSFSCRSLFSSRCLQRCVQFSLRLCALSDRSEQRSRPLGLRSRYGAGSPASSPSLLAFGRRQGCSWPCGYSQR